VDRTLACRVRRLATEVAILRRAEGRRGRWQRILFVASCIEVALRIASDILRLPWR